MATVTIEVASRETANQRIKAAFRGEPQGCFITFPTPEALWKTLTPKRWEIIRALTGAGPTGVRELSRRVGRDVKGVHTDVQALVSCGLVDKRDDGKLEFPYDAVHVDFVIKAA